MMFEKTQPRAVAVVVDPVQSVKGKVIIDAFRTGEILTAIVTQELRQVTSNLGNLEKANRRALLMGLNKEYYSLPIMYRKYENEQKVAHKIQFLKA
jgi:26S proteasome regulatory subunit N11